MQHDIDKTDWGDGPWQQEPDEVAWSFGDVPCRIVRMPWSGTLNGYVGVPPSHPWHGQDNHSTSGPRAFLIASVVDFEPELTFAGRFDDSTFATATDATLWWVGFDTDSIYDFAPARAAWERREGFAELADREFLGVKRKYRDLAYVTAAVERLAQQAIRASKGD